MSIEARRKASNKWNKKNRARMTRYAAKWRMKNLSRLKDIRLRCKYGISLENFNEMLKKQENKCAICPRMFDDKIKSLQPCVDHNHETNKIRGLLCRTCNRAIGLFSDDANVVLSAASYLRSYE